MTGIIKSLKHKLDIMWAVAVVTYKEWAAYRTHSMVSIFVGPVFYLVQIFIWQAVYAGHHEINGMGLENMLSYYGICALISYLTMDFADWNLQMLIHTGKYLSFAMRPVHHRFFAFSQKIGHRTLGFVFEFLPVLLIFTLVFRIPLVPSSWLWSVISIVLSFLMNFYINYCIGLAGFWLTKTGGLRGVVQLLKNVFSGALIPLVFFPDIMQKIIFFLPFQYIAYVPAMVFTGKYSLGGVSTGIPQIVAIQAAYVVIMLLLSEWLYFLGNKRFTGVGA